MNAPLREVFQMQFLYDETTSTSSGSLKALLAFDSCALGYRTQFAGYVDVHIYIYQTNKVIFAQNLQLGYIFSKTEHNTSLTPMVAFLF